jgi:hypothetical protein
MKNIFLLFALIPLGFNSIAQNISNTTAKAILDEVSAATNALEAIHINFDFTLSNSNENISESSPGSLIVKNEQYLLTFMGIRQVSNGETIWTVMEEDEEIQISEIDLDDEEALTPSNLLKMYESGFTYDLGDQKGNLQVIHLLPEYRDEVDYEKIELIIDTGAKQIKNITQIGENGTNSEYTIHTFSPLIIQDSAFILNDKDFSGYDIIDLR